MPFTIDIASGPAPSRTGIHVPIEVRHGFVWRLVVTVRAHLATRRLLRRLRRTETVHIHLPDHLRADIGLPPRSPSPTPFWEIRT